MVVTFPPADATLTELLVAHAHRATTRRLFAEIGGGLLVAALLGWLQPAGALALTSIAGCFVAYGSWAVAERSIESTIELRRFTLLAWAMVRGAAAALGIVSFVSALISTLGMALGTIIS